jgi:hypothetical protein
MQNWMTEKDASSLICPVCREENKGHVIEEWYIRTVTVLLKQHGSFLEQCLPWSAKYLRLFWEDVTLDPATAGSCLILSSDLRSVQCGKVCHSLVEDLRRLTHLNYVLGNCYFFSGRHYWEVEVIKGKEWALGVCKESAGRRRNTNLSCEHGFWIIGLKAGIIHGNSIPQRIPASPGLCHVGIYLDVDLEEIKFFDVKNETLIYKYSHLSLSFSDPLQPFFCPELPAGGNWGTPLNICP